MIKLNDSGSAYLMLQNDFYTPCNTISSIDTLAMPLSGQKRQSSVSTVNIMKYIVHSHLIM